MINLKDVQTSFLIEELKNRGCIHVLWHRDDVETAILEFGQTPSEDNITAIVNIIEKAFDASVGINWDVIGVHVHEYFNPRNDEN